MSDNTLNPMSKNIKWVTLDNSTGEKSLKQHAFKEHKWKTPWTREEYIGNKSLCAKAFCSEDGETAVALSDMEQEPFDESKACKKCIQILKNHSNV